MTDTTDAIQELIDKSGHGFHSRVASLLRKEKWPVLVSPYYSDNFTDKPREIDIAAERRFDVYAFVQAWLGTLNVRLFIECKYISGPAVFWFDSKDTERTTELVMRETGLEHPKRNGAIREHHYFGDTPVAKLFSSQKGKDKDFDNEAMSKAINQSLNSLVYYRHKNNLIPPEKNKIDQVLHTVSYPLIVVNSFEDFYKIDMADEAQKYQKVTAPFQLEVNYAYLDQDRRAQNEYFLIDVVSIDKLPEFLSSLEQTDVKIIREKLHWDKQFEQSKNRAQYGNNDAR